MKILVLLFIFLNLVAQDDYSLRVGYGQATKSDFAQAVYGDWATSPLSSTVLSLDAGYLLMQNFNDWPVDIYVKGGVDRFETQSGSQKIDSGATVLYFNQTSYAGRAYIKAYWNFDFLKNRVRFGLGEGVSYASDILNVEKYEADGKNDNNSRFLNYIDFSLDFSVGKLVKYKQFDEVYMGWVLEHRSGIFGLINNVRHGGSNYNTFYIESKF